MAKEPTKDQCRTFVEVVGREPDGIPYDGTRRSFAPLVKAGVLGPTVSTRKARCAAEVSLQNGSLTHKNGRLHSSARVR